MAATSWATPPEPEGLCADPGCDSCQLLEVGARAMTDALEVDWEQLSLTERRHYMDLLLRAQVAMLAATRPPDTAATTAATGGPA